MSAIVKQVTANELFATTYFTMDVGPGLLLALTCMSPSQYSDACEAYVEIGLCQSETDPFSRLVTLASGYVGNLPTVYFTGSIPLTSEEKVYAYIQSFTAVSYRLIAKVIPFSQLEKLGLSYGKQSFSI